MLEFSFQHDLNQRRQQAFHEAILRSAPDRIGNEDSDVRPSA
jgi:hypothetical protein